jgi:regulator of nucleoside diphosphate kinase
MTTIPLSEYRLSPAIVVTRNDYRQLAELAMAGLGSYSVADDLLHELDRAQVVDDVAAPANIVRMGSRVRFRIGAREQTGELVFPAEGDISAGRISVLTPVGTALIGLTAGQSISYRTHDGRPQILTLLEVLPPVPDDDDPEAA